MSNNNQRLELTWIGKGKEPKLEPRILIEDKEKSYGDPKAENILIYGDNLLALKALEQEFSGRIKCIFIDPPYNTGSAFEHYDDGLEHSQWLNLITPRLKLLKELLAQDGSIWISIDDNECHYLKVLCDEIFGRRNFIINMIWQKKFSPQNDAKYISDQHDHILVYAKNRENWRPNKITIEEGVDRAKNLDNDKRGAWKSVDYTCNKNKNERPNLYYPILQPNTGKEIWPKETAVWRFSKERHQENVANSLVYWGKSGKNSVPRFKKFEGEDDIGQVPTSILFHQDVGNTQDARKESLKLNSQEPFSTPKPEKLLKRILDIATNEDEFVLDSFLGSGTTSAVAHKMNRRWIGIELGDHAYTHCVPRMKKVVDGLDEGGITKSVSWKGGSGFKFYELAPSLLKKDPFGNWVIDPSYNADMLAAAMAKHEGYDYRPDELLFWKQGQSTEQDFIFTTTQFVTVELIDKIHEQMQEGESLLVCCKSYQEACEDRHAAINIRKIPVMLLGRCEFGKDDYSLNIINMPTEEDEEPFIPAAQKMSPKSSPEEEKPGGKQGKLF